jgi:uncharacterized protein (DUF302 family)
MSHKGIVMHSSQFTVKETIDRLVVFLQQHGATIYARINQQSEVHNAGLRIAPSECILFGNPKAGGLIMVENPMATLDLPFKLVAWEDESKKVWLAYNDPAYIEERYSLPDSLIGFLDLRPMITGALTS